MNCSDNATFRYEIKRHRIGTTTKGAISHRDGTKCKLPPCLFVVKDENHGKEINKENTRTEKIKVARKRNNEMKEEMRCPVKI